MDAPIPLPVAFFLAALTLVLAGGFAAFFARSSVRRAAGWGVAGAVSGGVLGLVGAVLALVGPAAPVWVAAASLPLGSIRIGMDPLSAVFLLAVFLLTPLAAVYAVGYWRHIPPARAASGWFWFNLLTASMALVLTARDAVLFLAAWELMTLASFRLVAFEPERPGTFRAAWIYLVASQFGAACLIAMFLRLGAGGVGTDFDRFTAFAVQRPEIVPFVLLCGLIGFGLKAGLMPLHGWLPLAHPAAPSPVSAVLSGVMIKTGIYGIARLTLLAGRPPVVWGWLLLGAGIASGIFGVLFALKQQDLKRLLAYSSVENIGIITLGMGLGILGRAAGLPVVAFLGWAGALFHVVNHALFKGLLFLGAGAVLHATGTGALDRLGGLLKRMPWTGWPFLIGAAAISGLPPFNGFASEFLLFGGGFHTLLAAPRSLLVGALAAIAALALMGGLAAACFVKAFGIVFLGEPRTPAAIGVGESGVTMRFPLATLAALCLLAGLGAPFAVQFLTPAVALLAGGDADAPMAAAAPMVRILGAVAMAGGAVIALTLALAGLRRLLLARRPVHAGLTWDCGYLRPTARMQYSAVSFSQPLLDAISLDTSAGRELEPPRAFHAEPLTHDAYCVPAWRARRDAVLAGIVRRLTVLRWVQHGRLHLYVLYIGLALLILLFAGVFR